MNSAAYDPLVILDTICRVKVGECLLLDETRSSFIAHQPSEQSYLNLASPSASSASAAPQEGADDPDQVWGPSGFARRGISCERRAPSTEYRSRESSEGCDQGSKPGVRGQGASFPSCGVLVCFTGATVTHRPRIAPGRRIISSLESPTSGLMHNKNEEPISSLAVAAQPGSNCRKPLFQTTEGDWRGSVPDFFIFFFLLFFPPDKTTVHPAAPSRQGVRRPIRSPVSGRKDKKNSGCSPLKWDGWRSVLLLEKDNCLVTKMFCWTKNVGQQQMFYFSLHSSVLKLLCHSAANSSVVSLKVCAVQFCHWGPDLSHHWASSTLVLTRYI